MDKHSAIENLQFNSIITRITFSRRPYIPAAYFWSKISCMQEKVKNLNLETFSVLCNKYLNKLQALFVYRLCIYWGINCSTIVLHCKGKSPLKMSSIVFVVEKCVYNKISSSISSAAVYLTHTVHWASLSTWVDSSSWILEALFDFVNAVICRSMSMALGLIRPMNSIILQRTLFQFM